MYLLAIMVGAFPSSAVTALLVRYGQTKKL